MSNIQEYFVPFEVAKELRDKGFNEECLAFYHNYPDEEPVLIMWDEQRTLGNCTNENLNDHNALIKATSAPMYDQVIDWFTIEHGLSINISALTLHQFHWRVKILAAINNPDMRIKSYSQFSDTRKGALNDAIKQALKLI